MPVKIQSNSIKSIILKTIKQPKIYVKDYKPINEELNRFKRS